MPPAFSWPVWASLLANIALFSVKLACFLRARSLAVAASLFLIVALSIVLGAALPIFLEKINAGASNAATTIQVVMDVSGVLITCAVCGYLLDGTSPLSVLLPGVGG